MAGHSKFANIKHRKGAVDKKRGRVFSQHAKAVMTAARLGGGDAAMNPRLALAIEKARADNVPKDNIERAIKKGTGELAGESLEDIRYEAYGPGGVALLVDVLTDNRNRTAPEMRSMMEKHGGRLAETGAVAWSFDARALVTISAESVDEDALTEAVMDLGGDDLSREGEEFEIYGAPTSLAQLQRGLTEKGYKVQSAEISMIPQNTIPVDAADAAKILRLLEALEDHEDVQATHSNIEISDEVMAQLEEE